MYSYIEYPEIPSITHTANTQELSDIIESQTGVCPLMYITGWFNGELVIKLHDFEYKIGRDSLMDILNPAEVDVQAIISSDVIVQYNEYKKYH